MIGAVLASMIKCVGDHSTCARVSGATPPTRRILGRAFAAEGICVILDGLWGKGSGSTASGREIAIIAITGVGSRAVIQLAACCLMLVGTLGKVTAILASLPPGIVGGMFCVVVGSLVALGLSNLKLLSLRSDRNLFIIGFSLFNCLSIGGPAGYFSTVDRGDTELGRIAMALFSNPMVIALILALVLDNAIPGTDEERGLHEAEVFWGGNNNIALDAAATNDLHNNDPHYVTSYSLPPLLAKLVHRRSCGSLQVFHRLRSGSDSCGAATTMPHLSAKGSQWPATAQGDLWELCYSDHSHRHRRTRIP